MVPRPQLAILISMQTSATGNFDAASATGNFDAASATGNFESASATGNFDFDADFLHLAILIPRPQLQMYWLRMVLSRPILLA